MATAPLHTGSYKVVGTQTVFGHAPGEVFTLTADPALIGSLVIIGHIAVATSSDDAGTK